MKLRTDTFFYRIGQGLWIPFILAGIWFAKCGYNEYHQLFECTFQRIVGLPCPGCGGTRAVYYLFHGDFLKSFQYHPVVIYGVLAYFHFMGSYFFRQRRKREEDREIQIPVYLYLAIGIILIQWLVKIFIILL